MNSLGDATTAAVVSTLGTILVGVLSFLGARRDRSPRVRHEQSSDAATLRVVKLRVPVPERKAPGVWSWRGKFVSFLVVACLTLVIFGYCIVRWIQSDLESYGWLGLGLVAEIPAGLCIGWAIAMKQVGIVRASHHTQQLRVAGSIDVIVDRSTDVLRAMRMRVTEVELTNDAACIKASPQMEPRTLSIDVSRVDDGADIRVTSQMPPSPSSFRRNVKHVTQFVERLTGVDLYFASLESETKGEEIGNTIDATS